MQQTQNTTLYSSEERQKLMEAAEKAGKVFERVLKAREKYALEELAKKYANLP